MRHGLKRVLILALALGLSACLKSAPEAEVPVPDAPAALMADEAIEVTPLDGPVSAEPAPVSPSASASASASAPVAEAPLAESAAPDESGGESAGDAASPRPMPRPVGSAPVASAEEDPAAPLEPPAPPKSQAQVLCESSGGIWGQSPDSGAFLCQKPTRDGGKQCTKKSQCEGECLARSGTCAPVTPLVGCNEVLDSKGRMVTLCLD